MSNGLNGRWVFRFRAGAIGSPRSLDHGTSRSAGVIDIERRSPLRDDDGFDRVRCRVLAPAQLQVRVHPCGQAGLVLVDEHDAVGAAGPVVLGIEQESGEGAAEGRLLAAAQVIPDDPPAQVRGETDIEQPYPGVDRVRGAGELRKHLGGCPPRVQARCCGERGQVVERAGGDAERGDGAGRIEWWRWQ